ncbi:MAG: zinc transporter ZntB [Rhodobacteraceae bacterium]|nr:MAG: zinc transporter ZntB [Paracoccaceae bacterium]
MALFVLDIDAEGRTRAGGLDAAVPEGHWRWVHFDLTAPGTEARVGQMVPPHAAEILLQPETRPRYLGQGEAMILILRGANFNPGQQSDDMVSLRLWAEAGLVITLRHRPVFAVRELQGELEAGARLAGGPGMLVAELVERLVDRIEQVSLALDDDVDDLEEAIVEPDCDPDILKPLPQMRRAAIRLIRYLRPQSDTLRKLEARGPEGPIALPPAEIRESANRAQRALEELDAVQHRLTALADHQYAQKADQLSRNGYGLSVVAAVFLPLGFVTGLFGMNVGGLPWTDTPAGFLIVCLGMAGAVALVLAVLRLLRLI